MTIMRKFLLYHLLPVAVGVPLYLLAGQNDVALRFVAGLGLGYMMSDIARTVWPVRA